MDLIMHATIGFFKRANSFLNIISVMYTDNSIKEDQLLEMELLLLTFYKWDVLACLSVDLVLPILNEFELNTETNDLKNKVRSLLDLCLIGLFVLLIY